MRVADALIKVLKNNDVKYVFGIPASSFGGILDALNDSDIEYIITKNEAGATYSASKYSDLSNKIGVCILAGGVGVNNGINGIAEAKRNKSPMLIISGDVRRSYMGKGALQEFNNARIVESITKHSINIDNAENVIEELQKSINIALTPPCGPVLISIPYDIQLLPYEKNIELDKTITKPVNDKKVMKLAIEEINKANTGIILVGRGTKGLSKEIKNLSQRLSWPIISTPNAKGVIDSDFPLYLGNYGFCSTDGAIEYVEKQQIDCVLILGTSLGQTATRDYNDVLVSGRKVIRIDWDKNEFNKVFKEDISVCYDLKGAIKELNSGVDQKNNKFLKPQLNKPYIKNHTGISLRLLFESMPEIVPENTCIIGDMGEFFNYIFKYMRVTEKMDFQTSINYACMGSGIAGAMGSYISDKNRPYAVVVGDGSFYMNGMEILTAMEYNMPITYLVINNYMFGLVKHGMKAIFGRDLEAKIEFKRNSIALIAQAMGIEAIKITSLEQAKNIKHIMENRTSPLIVEIITDGTEVFIDTDRLKKVN